MTLKPGYYFFNDNKGFVLVKTHRNIMKLYCFAENLPETMSASFLGASVLELTGHTAYSSWFTFLTDTLRETFPVVQKNAAILPDGSVVNPYTLDDQTPKQLEKWRQWSYYKLKYQEFKG